MKDVTWRGFIAVGLGGVLGCWLRYILSVLFNPLFLNLPPGTLAANWAAGFIMGCLIGIFQRFQTLPVEVRLFATTGVMAACPPTQRFHQKRLGSC